MTLEYCDTYYTIQNPVGVSQKSRTVVKDVLKLFHLMILFDVISKNNSYFQRRQFCKAGYAQKGCVKSGHVYAEIAYLV